MTDVVSDLIHQLGDSRLIEAAAQSATDLVATAFSARWPEIPSGQPEWLRTVGLATAAMGGCCDHGEALAAALVAGCQAKRIGELARWWL